MAVCPSAGQTAVAGGWMGGNEVIPVNSYQSMSSGHESWTINFHNNSTTQGYLLTPIVYCAS
ncbi:hypothetical protein ABT124_45425 [Streptomyces sp. NPDC001982]|uniref:hypothetical protein n=1 Tax=unclassified Streptomyces TaxID=2593676 RepID=UPI00332944BB